MIPDYIRRKLDASLADDPPAQPAAQTGYKLPRAGDKPKKFQTLLTDEEVLACRAAFEFEGATRAELVERFGVTPKYLRALLDYATRSKLIPHQYAVKKTC